MTIYEEIQILFKLKDVYRKTPNKDRFESTAEHTYSCLIFADYFFNKYKFELDKSRVFDLLLYHDIVEIESGDTFFMDEEHIKSQSEREREGYNKLKLKIYSELREKYESLYEEYEACETKESKFAHAIDKLEPFIHLLEYKDAWKKFGFTEENLNDKKIKYFEPFPEILKFYKEIMEYLKTNDFI